MVNIKDKIRNICRIASVNAIQYPISGISYKIWLGYQSWMFVFDSGYYILSKENRTKQVLSWICIDVVFLFSIIFYNVILKKYPRSTHVISVISYFQFGIYVSDPYLLASKNQIFMMANICIGGIIGTILIYDSISNIITAVIINTVFYGYYLLSVQFRNEYISLKGMMSETIKHILYCYLFCIVISVFFLYDRYIESVKILENKKIMKSWQKVMNIIGVAISIEKNTDIAYRNKLFKDLLNITPVSSWMEENNMQGQSVIIEDHTYKLTQQPIYFFNRLLNIYIAHDITSIQKEEENKYTQLLVATVTHELRAPLNIINQLFTEVEILADAQELKETAKKGLMATALQECLINDILDIAKINSGHFLLNPAKCNVKNVTLGVYSLLKLKVDKTVNFTMEIGEGFPENLVIDERRFKQLLLNLVTNSIKFTREGYISLHLHYSDDNLFCSVSDSGIGIPDNEKDKIFKQFGMITSTSAMNVNGTGLGLNLCKRLLTSMGGDITFSSKVNSYTVFTFWIPCMRDQIQVLSHNDSQLLKCLLKCKSVLNIDDEFMNLSVLNSYASRFGLQHFSFRNAKDALFQMESGKMVVAIAFIDINMPEMSGYDVAKKLKSLNNELLLIALSGEDRQSIQGHCYQAGFNEVMEKPLKYEEYCNCINKYFGKAE